MVNCIYKIRRVAIIVKIIRAVTVAFVTVCLLLSSCKSAGSTQSSPTGTAPESSEKRTSISLPYYSGDYISPYRTSSEINFNLSTLLYDGLCRVTPSFSTQYVIAEKIENVGTTVTVVLKSGITFSDGTPLTANDVVYSYRRAAESVNYKNRFSGVSSVSKSGDDVVFKLKTPDAMFDYLLDFPIMKNQSDATSHKNAGTAPTGSGRYVLNVGEKTTLSYNASHFRGQKPAVETIELTDVHDVDLLSYHLKSGSVSLAVSKSDNISIGTSGLKSVALPMNNLVFVGLNAGNEFLKEASVRRAIAAAIDKESVREAGAQRGASAVGLFNPSYRALIEQDIETIETDRATVEATLKGLGFEKGADGVFYKDGKKMSLSILYNSDNVYKKRMAEEIASQLSAVGIETRAEGKSFKSYSSAVTSGGYDICVGEIIIPLNCDFSSLLTSSVAKAFYKSEELLSAVAAFRSDKTKINQMQKAFNDACPFIPVCYKNGIVVYENSGISNIVVSANDIFYNIEAWKI